MTGRPDRDLQEGGARVLGRQLSAQEIAQFSIYLDLLSEWNRVHRMVGSSDRRWLVENIVLDSLLFLSALRIATGRHDAEGSWPASILDIGSGAGVPGIPIKIVRPEVEIVLVESRRKRASFLAAAVRALRLEDATVVHDRAEVLVERDRRFDAVVARCAGRSTEILDLGTILVAGGGSVVVSTPSGKAGTTHGRRVVLRSALSGEPRHFIISGRDQPRSMEEEAR